MIKWLLSTVKNFVTGAKSDSGLVPASRTDTEFSAEVVRITQILEHSNADKLQIARFEMKGLGETSYEVVIQKGTFQVGDLAAYFSVDCILPLDHPDFQFLTSRADGQNKSHYRLRAARLRGVFSQGLLVPLCVTATFGTSVATEYGVTYYRAPEEETKGPTQPNAKKRAKNYGVPDYSVDSLKKNARLFHDGEAVFITEKIHGTNFRFGWIPRKFMGIRIGWRFVIGSHHTIKSDPGGKGFYGDNAKWFAAAEQYALKSRTKNHKGLMFYGELYGYWEGGAAIQPGFEYGRTATAGPGLAIFDVRDMSKGCYLGPFGRFDLVDGIGLKLPPILEISGPYSQEVVSFLAEQKGSVLSPRTCREGVVVESLGGERRKAKYVSQQYLLQKKGD